MIVGLFLTCLHSGSGGRPAEDEFSILKVCTGTDVGVGVSVGSGVSVGVGESNTVGVGVGYL